MKMETPAQPRTKTRSATSARWQGALEGMHRGMLYGWAVDTAQPDARVVLEICMNGDPIGCLSADVARSDLAAQFDAALPESGPADHCHGFVADLGIFPADHNGVLTVRVANTACLLPGHVALDDAPKPSVSASSYVFGDGALRLQGWAVDTRDEKRHLEVRAYVGNELVAQAPANEIHPALRSYEVGEHGFSLSLPLRLADGRVHSVRVVDQDGNVLNGSPLTICCYANGCKALLPGQSDTLLSDVIDNYERHLPRSLGMEHYRQWSASFETAPAAGEIAETLLALRVGVIVGAGEDDAARERTLESLRGQRGVVPRVFGGAQADAGKSFQQLLQEALDAGCDILGCVRAGDALVPHALARALEGFGLHQAQLVYVDSEHAGKPWFKPAWNPEYALASDYPLDGMLMRSELARKIVAGHGAPDSQAGLCWSALSLLWAEGAEAIVHVPHVLYLAGTRITPAEQQQRNAAAGAALRRVEAKAQLVAATETPPEGYAARRVLRPLSKRERKTTVSLIIPTRDRVELLERCIDSIAQHTQWENLEIIVVDNDSALAKTKTYLRKIAKQGVKVLHCPGPFNFAALNNLAVAAAGGEIVGMINNDIEAVHEGWLDEILSHLLRPEVGAVGAKLLWPNGMVQHGGVLLGVGNVAGHYGNRLADKDWGDHGRNQLVQQVSGVTAACLFLRKRDYLAVGGMDAAAFPVAFNDVDLCLKLGRAGKAIVWTPHAKMLHAESASRGHEDTPQKRARAQREIDQLRARWGEVLLRDPAYHPALSLDAHGQAYGGLALPPRDRRPRLAGLKQHR